MDFDDHLRTTWIVLGTLSGLGIVIAILQTCIWFWKSGREVVDLLTIGKFSLYIAENLGTVITLVIGGVSVWWLVIGENTYNDLSESETNFLETLVKVLLIVACALKTLNILHIIVRQTTINIFLMDWERPNTPHSSSVSAWRTCFVANELNEIQTFRRIHVPFHLLFVLFLLKVINLENLAQVTQNSDLFSSSSANNVTTEYNPIFHTGIAFLLLLGTAVIQYLSYMIVYERFIEDKIMNFIDLCSVSNISVFILDQHLHGFYIHGRSPYGTTDVNMQVMIKNLDRESHALTGTRGLQINSTEQIFTLRINKRFRQQYDAIFRRYYESTGLRQRQKDKHDSIDMLFESYQNVNRFLCAFIDHSLPNYEYYIRKRFLLEKILNHEFPTERAGDSLNRTDNVLFVDHEKIFTNIFFYGEENSLFLWNLATYLLIDSLSSNYILATIITYFLNLILVKIRNSLGRRNLSRKTLVPRKFLI